MNKQLSFGRWLRRRRGELGLSQQDLGEQINISPIMLRKIEADERRPSRQIALSLAAQLGVPPDEHSAFLTFARSEPTSGADENEESDVVAAAPWRNLLLGRTNLPAALTRLIGREQDIAALRDLLLAGRLRLLTLSGPPGIGKTSLALAVAESLLDEFADGVYLVELAGIEQPEAVIPTIARTLGLEQDGAAARLAGPLAELRDKRMLLLLDNFEHLLDAGPAITAALKACPWLRVLVTSREALHVRSERQYTLSPLALPEAEPGFAPDLPWLAANPAVALFVERAGEVAPGFALTEQNASDLAAICVLLDGLPLAIELAAGRVGLLAPQQIRAALQNRLQLLTGGPRDLPPRQRTLRGAIDWSYTLLAPDEERLFARLAVFAGGGALDDIIAVAAAGVGAATVPAVIESLLAKNLLGQVVASSVGATGGAARLTMLQTIREYALERLEASGEAEIIRERHARYYLALAEENAPELSGPDAPRLLAWFESEHDNMSAALGWLLATPSGADEVERLELAIRLCAALWQLWKDHGHLSEGRQQFSAVLERINRIVGTAQPDLEAARRLSPALPGLWATALSGAGTMAGHQGDTVTARAWYEQSLLLRRQLGDKLGMSASLFNLGVVAHNQGDYEAARTYQLASLALARELKHSWKIALSLNSLGIIEDDACNLAAARRYYSESLALAREIDATMLIGMVLNNLGIKAGYEGDFAAARTILTESLVLHRQLDDRHGIVYALVSLGSVACDEGQYDESRRMLLEGLRLLREIGDKRLVAEYLEVLASLAAMTRQGERAARLFGAAAALRETYLLPLSPSERAHLDRYLAAAQAHLPPARWQIAHDEGRTMTVERMILYALGQVRR